MTTKKFIFLVFLFEKKAGKSLPLIPLFTGLSVLGSVVDGPSSKL